MWCEWVETYAPDKWTAFFYFFIFYFWIASLELRRQPVVQLVHEDVFKYCKID